MFAAFSSANFTIGGGFAPLGGGAIFGALASGGIVFAYSGLRQILDFGGEVVNPQRNIPIAIVVGGRLIKLKAPNFWACSGYVARLLLIYREGGPLPRS
jgi:amino acid transporter